MSPASSNYSGGDDGGSSFCSEFSKQYETNKARTAHKCSVCFQYSCSLCANKDFPGRQLRQLNLGLSRSEASSDHSANNDSDGSEGPHHGGVFGVKHCVC